MKQALFFSLAATAVLLSACCRRAVRPRVGQITVDTLFTASGTDFEVGYDFASIRNTKRSAALEAIEQSNIHYFFGLEAFEGSARAAADTALRQVVEQYAAPGMTWPVQIGVASQLERVDTLLVCMIRREEFTGGAHGLATVEYHNYSLEGGYELASGDLFAPGAEEPLTRLIADKLLKIYGVDDLEGLAALGFFPEQIAPTENFALTEQGLRMIYNPYEIACYAVGIVEVPLSWTELEPYRLK